MEGPPEVKNDLIQKPPWLWGKTAQTEPTLPGWLRAWAEEWPGRGKQ